MTVTREDVNEAEAAFVALKSKAKTSPDERKAAAKALNELRQAFRLANTPEGVAVGSLGASGSVGGKG